jgi:predicted transglutaminase-like cysteine proteinase
MRSPSGLRIAVAAVVVACLALALSLAVRHGASGATPHAAPTGTGDSISELPPGFTSFRMRYPDEVRDSPPAVATNAQIALAEEVNEEINKRITWRETRLWSVELAPHAYGDCKAYSLTKRHVLREKGFPDGAFRLAIVYAAKYRGLHMILEMRTRENIYVLDSLENDARREFYTLAAMPSSYSLVKYQDWGKPQRWMAPAGLVAENTRAMRRLHREVARIDTEREPWDRSLQERGQHRTSASREPRQ